MADCDAFLAALAERYFRITCEAVRAADPNHIVFGCRFAYVPRAAGGRGRGEVPRRDLLQLLRRTTRCA